MVILKKGRIYSSIIEKQSAIYYACRIPILQLKAKRTYAISGVLMLIFPSFTSNSRGVAILLNNNFEYKVIQQRRDNSGNMLALSISIDNKMYTLIVIYAPNDDSPDFFHRLFQVIDDFNNSNVVVVGDYNLVIDTKIDYYNYLHINNPRAREKVLELIDSYDLVDIFRELHPEDRMYTWRKPNPVKQARLDFFLISETLLVNVCDTAILNRL